MSTRPLAEQLQRDHVLATRSLARQAAVVAVLSFCSFACAQVSPRAVDSNGVVTVRVVGVSSFSIDGHIYPTEAAISALKRLQQSGNASSIEFLIDPGLLQHSVLRSDPFYNEFKGCSAAEERAYLLRMTPCSAPIECSPSKAENAVVKRSAANDA